MFRRIRFSITAQREEVPATLLALPSGNIAYSTASFGAQDVTLDETVPWSLQFLASGTARASVSCSISSCSPDCVVATRLV